MGWWGDIKDGAASLGGGMVDLADFITPGEFDGIDYRGGDAYRTNGGSGWGFDQGRGLPIDPLSGSPGADALWSGLFGTLNQARVASRPQMGPTTDQAAAVLAHDRKVKAARARAKAKKNGSATSSPYDAQINALLKSGSAVSTKSTKESRKAQQKVINEAIMAARAPYDQAIVEARTGLKDALTVNKRLQTGFKADTGGGEARDAEYRKGVDAEAAALVEQAAKDTALSEPMTGGEAATRLAQADDARANNAIAQAEALKKASMMQTEGARQQVSGINNFIQAEESETRGKLSRDAQRQVQRLQKERAAAIAEAKAQTRAGLIDQESETAIAMQEAANENRKMAIQLMGLRQQDMNSQRSAAMRQWEAMQKMQQANQPKPVDPLDALKILIGMGSKTVPRYQADPIPAYAPAQIDSIARALGLSSNPLAPPVQSSFGDMLGSWAKQFTGR